MTSFARIASILLGFVVLVAGVVLFGAADAQEDDSEEKGRFVSFVEDKISTPDRRISIGSIDGVLSSDVRIASITVSDRQGEYLRLENVHLVWSRLALLRGRLDVDLLEADRIVYSRNPVASGTPDPAASSFAVPELPVEVLIDRLAVPAIELGAPVLGAPATLSVDGSINLTGGALDSNLAIVRTDGPGGRFAIKVAYANETEQLDLDLSLEEAQNGVVSNLLGIPDRPALGFRIAGSGPVSNFAADIALAANGAQLVSGRATIAAVEGGYRFITDVNGNLQPLVPAAYADYVAGSSRLAIDATRAEAGGVTLSRLDLSSGVLTLAVNGALAPDGFPTRISVDGRVGKNGEGAVVIPGNAAGSIGGGTFQVSFGGEEESWTAVFDVEDFRTETLNAGRARIEAGGIAANLQDPAARSLTFDLSGDLSGITAPDAALARAVSDAVTLAATGRWTAGEDVAVERAFVRNANAALNFSGVIGADVNGRTRLNAASLEPFSGLAGRTLAGALDVALDGRFALIGGAFDLVADGTATDVSAGIPALDPLLKGETRLTGRVLRDTEGLRFDALDLVNAQAEVRLDGMYDLARADLSVIARLADLALVTPRAKGPVNFDARLTGNGETPDVTAAIRADALDLSGKPLRNAEARFVGRVAGADVDGDVTVAGSLADVALNLAAAIATDPDGTRRLDNLVATAGETRATGSLATAPDGLTTGNVRLTSPDISVIAPLFLVDGSGAVDADITLRPENGEQSATVKATARDLQVAAVRIGTAAIDAVASDLLGRPVFGGEAQAAQVVVAGVTVETLRATATPNGDAFDVDAAASVSGGSVTVTGTVGDALQLAAEISGLPAAIANGFVADLGAAGTISGRADVSGTFAAPVVDFRANGTGLTANALRTAGLSPLALESSGRFADNAVTFEATVSGAEGLSLRASGRAPLAGVVLDVAVTGSAPLSVANSALAERGARVAGTAQIEARVTGSVQAPAVAGSATVDGATLNDPETGNRLTGIGLTLRFDGTTATVERLVASTPRGGSLSGRGTIGLTGDRPVDVSVNLARAAFASGDLARGEVSGTVTATGALAGTVTLGGRLVVDRVEITVPERLSSNATLLDVRHRLPPVNVRRTLERARIAVSGGRGGAAPAEAGGIVFDLQIDAPARIFVRGRGLDAELGGSVRLTGPISAVQPVGSFEMRRGRLDIIGQRITFDRGTITLVGNLNPLIDFSATSSNNGISVTASVTGSVSDPTIVLSSSPQLPQDEILAQFLFGRSITELSPFQIARLAAAVAQFSGGGGGPDLLGRLRNSTGLDNLDIVTDSSGNAAVEAGRYISENVYLGVTAGGSGQSRVSVNLDITDNLKARAEVGTDAGTRAGIYYEKEY
ncbi:translocation/assembly module TamB domain-containing protein [Chthonobacter albigriseus]|uniref:translocation/assembly module TamB domain-containing protein n=1 Tax=Chthonobacter albigriseus TaxID=1683161 RepID=UPI0015EFC43C|nr:translocation/assembly module TamB domain-containing protein [Chthonobacter albigriseus]